MASLVLFNDPIPCNDPAVRAVKLAVELSAAVEQLCAGWHQRGHRLGMGIGIAYGYARLGQIGFEGRFDYTAIGTVVNQAARLCGEAKPGEILVTQRVATAAEGRIAVEPLGELVLKGLRQPVAGFRLRRDT
jgi:class 3 adenylate cyclase